MNFVLRLFIAFPLSATLLYASPQSDSLAFIKFMDGAKKNSQQLTSYACISRSTMEVTGIQNMQGITMPKETTTVRTYSIYPDRNRVEIKSKQMNVVTVTNKGKSYVLDPKTNKFQIIDSSAAKGAAPQTTTADFLKLFAEKPKFKVLPGDTSAELWGRFNQNGQSGIALMTCDLKRNLISEYSVTSGAGEALTKLSYVKIGEGYFLKKMVMTTNAGQMNMVMTTALDSIQVNKPTNAKLFEVK